MANGSTLGTFFTPHFSRPTNIGAQPLLNPAAVQRFSSHLHCTTSIISTIPGPNQSAIRVRILSSWLKTSSGLEKTGDLRDHPNEDEPGLSHRRLRRLAFRLWFSSNRISRSSQTGIQLLGSTLDRDSLVDIIRWRPDRSTNRRRYPMDRWHCIRTQRPRPIPRRNMSGLGRTRRLFRSQRRRGFHGGNGCRSWRPGLCRFRLLAVCDQRLPSVDESHRFALPTSARVASLYVFHGSTQLLQRDWKGISVQSDL